MGYIKTHSNYVLKKHHQLTNDGAIYERDITTIGGLNQFAKGQTPIYQSGNFIITINSEPSYVKDYSNNSWVKNTNSNDETWTLADISGTTNISNGILDVIKQDYYNLVDFAYYGSCSELIRASITDIIDRFPGELYAPIFEGSGITVFYTDKSVNDADQVNIYEDGWYLLDNPFNINLHTLISNKNDGENELKYFCNNGYSNYLISNNENFDENNDIIKSWDVTTYICGKSDEDDSNENIRLIADIILTYGSNSNVMKIKALKGDNGAIVYLTDADGLGLHIRPKKSFYDNFFKTLDSFQSILLNRNSNPKYSVLFEIINENSFGYYTEMKRFTFPTTFGGYNLSVNDPAYSTYINNLVDVANYYDENFCDNLYRSLTHEAIKNFDWSYKREYSDGDSDDYVFGGTRIQNILRLIGREFDEIKYYIDNINNANVLSYDNNNNMPNYFLSDSLVNDGWDLTNITPFLYKNNKYISDDTLEITPYSSNLECVYYKEGYFINFNKVDNENSECEYTVSYESVDSDNNKKMYKVNNNILMTRIKQYFDETKYTMNDVNNLFMKLLRLNSRHLYSHKGTIEGIEMLLSLFGLRSKRWYDKKKIMDVNQRVFSPYNSFNCDDSINKYDYEIKEYVAFASLLKDEPKYNGNYEVFVIDWHNQTKTITYDTDDYRNGVYMPYQGLPVKYYNKINDDNSITRYLVPYFDNDIIIDGNPHYQTDGGWLWKSHQFNVNDELVTNTYTETIKNVPSVSNLKELFALPYKDLTNGSIFYVRDITSNYIIIDGIVYDIFTEVNNSLTYEYFKVTVSNNCVKVGQQIFIDEILVSSPYGIKQENSEIKEEIHYLINYNNGDEIKIYIIEDHCSARDSFILDFSYLDATIFKKGKIVDNNITDLCNYFQITDRNYKNKLVINGNGWIQLSSSSEELKKIDNLENYFNGNNPHTGNLKYDSGEKYLSYFKKLFKYAIENKEFDPRCYYGKTMDEIIAEVDKYGFKLIDEFPVDKLDYFGDYYQSDIVNGVLTTTCFQYKDNVKDDDENTYNLTMCSKWKTMSDKSFFDGNNGYPEQILNTKRIDIIFNVDNNQTLPIKYIDSVILKYLSQMIPHNTLVKIFYKKEVEN